MSLVAAHETINEDHCGQGPILTTADVSPISMPLATGDYHSQFGYLSHSMIQQFLQSRTMYQRRYVTRESPPKKSTKPMEIGTIVHEYCLLGRELTDICRPYPEKSKLLLKEFSDDVDEYDRNPDANTRNSLAETIDDLLGHYDGDGREYLLFQKNGSLNGANAKRFRQMMRFEKPDVQFWLNPKDWKDATEAIAALEDHETLWSWIRGEGVKREQSFYWTDENTGLRCRQQTDFHKEFDDCVLALDLKVTEFGGKEDFCRQWFDSGKKWLQPQHYARGLFAHYKKPVFFGYVTVKPSSSDTGHYTVRRHSASTWLNDQYEAAYNSLLGEIAECYSEDDWREPDEKTCSGDDYERMNILNPKSYSAELPGIGARS